MNLNRYHHLSWLHGIELFEASLSTQTFARHAHEGFAIGAIAEGVGGYFCRGERMVLPAGSLSLMNPEEAHTGYADTCSLRYNMLYVSEAAVCDILGVRSLLGFSTVAPKDRGFALSKALSALAARLTSERSLDWHLSVEEAVHDVLSKSFCRYGRTELRPAGAEHCAVSRLREQIAAGVETGADLSLSLLADTAQLNQSYLIRITRRATGLTPHGLVVRARVEKAHQLLLQNTSAASAALAAGFCDQAHMIRQYRRHFGVTPSVVFQHT
jgi:AraC-like DNA-binding protein